MSSGANQRVSVYCLTMDDWYPSYCLKTTSGLTNGIETPMLVEVTLQTRYQDYPFRIVARGADDFMMSFETQDETKVRNTYLEVIAMPYVNKDALKKIGFKVD